MKLRHAAALALVGWCLMVVGAGGLAVFIVTSVWEASHWSPVVGLRQKHLLPYVDIGAAALSPVFIAAGYFLALMSKLRN